MKDHTRHGLRAWLKGRAPCSGPFDRISQVYVQINSEWASLARIEELWATRPEVREAPFPVALETLVRGCPLYRRLCETQRLNPPDLAAVRP